MGLKIVKRDGDVRDAGPMKRIVMCELLIPDIPNSWGDIYSKDAIEEFMFEYARQGYYPDIGHDLVDASDKILVIESFIARKNDPDEFIEGSWVIGMKIMDDEVWQKILDGELNGYSYQADCWMTEIVIQNLRNRQITGVTEPDLVDGHTHEFLAIIDALNRPITGATSETNGHSHRIVFHTVTELGLDVLGEAGIHNHRYQVIVADTEVKQ